MANKHDIQRLSPDQLVTMFSQSPFSRGIVLAFVIHIVVIAVTSVGFVWRTYISPETAEEEPVEIEAPAQPQPPRPEPQTETRSEPTAAETAQSEHDALMEQYKDTPTVRAITEAADPDEIPDMPDGLGISLDETNPF